MQGWRSPKIGEGMGWTGDDLQRLVRGCDEWVANSNDW